MGRYWLWAILGGLPRWMMRIRGHPCPVEVIERQNDRMQLANRKTKNVKWRRSEKGRAAN